MTDFYKDQAKIWKSLLEKYEKNNTQNRQIH